MDDNLVNILSYCDNNTLMNLLKKSEIFKDPVEAVYSNL